MHGLQLIGYAVVYDRQGEPWKTDSVPTSRAMFSGSFTNGISYPPLQWFLEVGCIESFRIATVISDIVGTSDRLPQGGTHDLNEVLAVEMYAFFLLRLRH